MANIIVQTFIIINGENSLTTHISFPYLPLPLLPSSHLDHRELTLMRDDLKGYCSDRLPNLLPPVSMAVQATHARPASATHPEKDPLPVSLFHCTE